MVVLIVLCLGVCFFLLLAPYVCFHILVKFGETEWPPIGEMADISAYNML